MSDRENKTWLVTLALWGLSTIPLYWLWNWHFPNDLLDQLWGFVLWIAAFCFVFLVMPLHALVQRFFPEEQEQEPAPNVDDDIRIAGTSDPARLKLLLKLFSIRPERNTAEQTAQLEAVKRLLSRRK